MSKPKITDAQLKQELAAHTPVPNIAKKYNMTAKGIRAHITRLHKKRRQLSSEEIWEELLSGSSRQDVADKYDVTEATIYYNIHKMGGMQKLKEEMETKEENKKSYGQRQAEKLKEQTRINPNVCLQTLLENEKTKTRQLSQRLQELEAENAMLRSGMDISYSCKKRRQKNDGI